MSAGDLSIEARSERVLGVVRAARRLADAADPLGREARRLLPEATGLSEEGVDLGLSRHLETSVSNDDLRQLVARAGSAPRVHVVLSANVFVGVVRAVALAVAAAPWVRVRPSSREAVMAPLLLRASEDRGRSALFALSPDLEPAAGDHVHVYGRRETIDAVRARCPADVVVRGHGPGFGIALVEPREMDVNDAAARLSRDIVPFDQRGCLSPRIAFVLGTESETETFASALSQNLAEREREVPRGLLDEAERQAGVLYRRTLQAVGTCYGDGPFAVGLDLRPRALVLPPSGRHIHVVRVSTQHELELLLNDFRSAITCIGYVSESSSRRNLGSFLPRARFLPLGVMQCPPLDGPVDMREML